MRMRDVFQAVPIREVEREAAPQCRAPSMTRRFMPRQDQRELKPVELDR
jgi:hypothetical protein